MKKSIPFLLIAVSFPLFAFASTSCVTLTTSLSFGSRSTEVTALQTFLHNAYQEFPTPTGYFGPLTQAAVKQWQGEHGISRVGVVGPQTRAAMACSPSGSTTSTSSGQASSPQAGALILTRNLSLGSTGSDVTALQQFLVGQGLLSVTPTGYFGALTQAAVQRYQSLHNIISYGSPSTTGYGAVGPKTRASIAATPTTTTGAGSGSGSGGTTVPVTSGPTFTSGGGGGSTSSGGGGGGGGGSTPPPPPPPPPASCSQDGVTVSSGTSAQFFSTQSVTLPASCSSVTQTRTCQSGTFGGDSSYRYAACSAVTTPPPPPPSPQSCTWNNATVQDGASVSAYQSSSVSSGQQCTAQARTCQNGTLSGSYTNTTCTVQPPPLPPPTVSYTLNGLTNIVLHVGDTLNEVWSSMNAVSASSFYTQDSSSCGVSGTGPFDLGFTPTSGSSSEKVTDCWTGHTYTVTVTAADAQGRTASASATITVPAPTTYSVKDYGAKGDGVTNDSTAIQTAINTASANTASGIAQVHIPCGTYIIGQTITLKSNMHLYGDGSCSTFKAAASLPISAAFAASTGLPDAKVYFILTNADYTNGNTNMTLDSMTFDFSALKAVTGTSNVMFRNVSNVTVRSISTNYGDDGVAFLKSSNFTVTGSTLTNHNNAALDSWDGDSHYTYSNNIIDNAGAQIVGGWTSRQDYGMVATGVSSQNTATGAGINDVHFTGNTIRNVTNGAIWIQGGYDAYTAAEAGSVQNFEVSNNTIDGVSAYHGIRVSEGFTGTIANNTIRNIAASGIIVAGEYADATQSDITMSGNTITNTNILGGTDVSYSAIYIGPGSTRFSITGNTVSGSAQPYSLFADARSSAITASGNTLSAGKFGKTADRGTGNSIQDTTQTSVRTYQSGNMLYLDTGVAKIGVDLNWGASIVDLEKGTASYVNRHDTGREVQLALWDRSEQYDTCSGCTGVFGWNPVQAGGMYEHGSKTLSWSLAGNIIYSKTQPTQWYPTDKGGGPNQPVPVTDVVMEQWISAIPQFPQAFKVHYKISYTGTVSRVSSGEELPAVYTNGAYNNFKYYSGTVPWTNAPLTTITGGNPYGQRYYDLERWAALVDESGDGLTVYTPGSLPYVSPNINLNSGSGTGPTDNATSYFSPFVTASVVPGAVLEGDFYIIAGNYTDARSVVYQLRTLYPAGDISSTPFGAIDTPHSGNVMNGVAPIAGWIIGNNPIARIDVLVDGMTASSITPATVARQDVQNDYPNTPLNSGFSGTLDTGNFSAGSHTLTIKATDTKGNTGIVEILPVTFGVNRQPTGVLDSVDSLGLASGWAYDPDASSQSSGVSFYIDGPTGQGQYAGTVSANIYRADVNTSRGINGNHGFSWQIPPQYLNGSHALYAYGIDISNPTISALLESSPKSYTSSIPALSAPVGTFDGIYISALAGWTYDPDASSQSIPVAIYVDGPKGTGTLVTTIPANTSRPDVNSGRNITGNHGFAWPIPSQYLSSTHSWYVYGIDITDPNSAVLLDGSPKTYPTTAASAANQNLANALTALESALSAFMKALGL